MGLIVVTGPPCAGKSTYVDEHRTLDDVVIDLDRIAVALGQEAEHVDWSEESPHRVLARGARSYLIRTILDDHPGGGMVWLIDTSPRSWQRANYMAAGACFVDLDPGREVCHERAKASGRTVATHGQIERWYDRG